MAYRPLTRLLGKTSLERKCLILFGCSLLLLILGSFWWYSYRTDRLVLEQNRRGGRGVVDAIMAVEHWRNTEPNDEFREFLEQLADSMRSEDYSWRAIKPVSSDGARQAQDIIEHQLLEQWDEAGRDPNADLHALRRQDYARHLPEKHEFQYYQPIYATEQYCLDCHRPVSGNANMRLNDLLAIIQVSFDDRETVQAQRENRAFLLTTAIVTVALAMGALYLIVRFVIVKPLTHLRDVSDEISRGNLDLRADIQTGDEFEKLGDAFNRMLRHMAGAHQELRGLNADLDAKVDELAQVNMRLYEMNRLKSDFLATVSHELRTPLNSIIGFSDVLSTNDQLEEKQQRYVQNIQRSGRMLLEMINDILDLAKIESGKMEVRATDFKIEQVITAQCDMARPLTERKNIDLDFDVAPGLPILHQDQNKVQQISSNLLSNAIKFTPEGGRITISARNAGDGRLALVVSDTGVGIADEDQVAVFEKFRQGSSVLPEGDAMTREYSGTGLGLSIVKELCKLLGGEVTMESELGKGSAFTITLPWEHEAEPLPTSDFQEQADDLSKPRRLDPSAA